MTILICLIIAYLAAVAGFWVVIAVIWESLGRISRMAIRAEGEEMRND